MAAITPEMVLKVYVWNNINKVTNEIGKIIMKKKKIEENKKSFWKDKKNIAIIVLIIMFFSAVSSNNTQTNQEIKNNIIATSTNLAEKIAMKFVLKIKSQNLN